MKRVLSLVLVLLIVLSTIMPAFAEDTSVETLELASFGVISGDGNSFNEEGELKRSEFTVILSQLYGLKTAAQNYEFLSSFSDVPAGEWYTPYVSYAEKMKWMSGMGDGTFAPTATMTAQQVNAMYVKALGYDIPWDSVNYKADQLGIAVVASNPSAVRRGEAFKSLRKALDVVPNGEDNTLGSKLPIVNYVSPIEEVPVVEVPTGEVTVKALNLKQIQITFGSKINEAGDEDNYSIDTDGSAVLDSNSDFDLSSDGKTVIITLTDAADQQEILELTIEDILADDETVEVEFIDLKIPTVILAEGAAADTIKVEFSEPMLEGLADTSSYSVVDSDGNRVYVKSVTAGSNDMSALVVLFADLEGNEVITVSDVEDYQGFRILDTELTVDLEIDNEAPVVVSYKNASQNGVTLVFDSEINFEDSSLSNFYHTNTSNDASDVSIDDNELIIEFTDEMPVGTAYVYVKSDSIVDLWGNLNDKEVVTVKVEIDETAPVVVGSVDVTSQNTIEVTFDQDVVATGDDFDVTLLGDTGNDATASVDDEVLELTFEDDLLGSYTVVIEGVEDENGNVAEDISLSFKVYDETAPETAKFKATLYDGTTQTVVVTFGEDMDAGDITNKALYFYGSTSFDDSDVDFSLVDAQTVEIKVPSSYVNLIAGQDLTIGRVADSSGNLMDAIYIDLELEDGDGTDVAIKSVELIDEDTVVLTVDGDKLVAIDTDEFSFTGGNTIGKVSTSTNSENETVITFTLATDVETDATFSIEVDNGAGENSYGQTLETGIFPVDDAAAPVVVTVDHVNSNVIIITFSEPLNDDTFAPSGANGFSVTGGDAELTSVTYAASVVTITGTDFTEDTNVYYNSLFGIEDMEGNELESFSKTGTLD